MSRHQDGPTSNTRVQLVERAQLQCYEARSQCFQARHTRGHVPRKHRLALQQAIVNYYWALKPFKERPAVDNWWEDVALTEDGLDGVAGEIAGVDMIDTITGRAETITQERHTVRGTFEETNTIPVVLEFRALKDISSVLDDAAGKLGFIPPAPTPDETDPTPV